MTGRKLYYYLDKISPLFPLCRLTNRYLLRPINTWWYWARVLFKYFAIKNELGSCGTNLTIHPGTIMKHLNLIKIGNNVSIHPMCYIDGEGGITIGNNVSIAHNTTIMSSNHTWNCPDKPIKYCAKKLGEVKIDDDVWIGCGVRIMAGVTIGKRCVIGAGSIVTHDIEPNGVYGGVPAKLIKRI